ncbi:MAG: sulfurtransferase TusA family protein [Pseudomonadota bacterium]
MQDGTVTEIDARGLLCPLPVLRLRKGLARLAPGDRVLILADDPMAAIDIPHFCTEAGHVLETQATSSDGLRFLVRHG